MRKTSNIPQHDFTQQYNFIKGNFSLSKTPIPYYMFSMPLHYVANDLSLVSDLHNLSLELFDVNNVFQRNIDTKRVENDIVKGYLNDSEKIKFFNPITIAFIPNKENKIVDKYELLEIPTSIANSIVEGTAETVSSYFPDAKNLSNILLLEDTSSDLGILCWDKKSVHAIAIDGQHRLSALKSYYENRPEHRDVLIPIIAIVFNDFSEKNLITYLREIFIDINKSAKPVKKTRNIILDDREISAVLTKDLIYSESNRTEEDNINSIRSEVFDWQSDDPRPESPFQLTSIMIIHRIISELFLENKELRNDNSWDEKKINRFINMLNKKFKIDQQISNNNLKLTTLAQQTIEREGTFSLKQKHFELIIKEFRTSIKPIFYKVYTEFYPFKKFMEIAESIEIFNQEKLVNKYIRLPKISRDKYIQEYHSKLIDGAEGENFVPETIFNELIELKKDNLLFNIIGQVAIFKVLTNQSFSLLGKYTLDDFFNSINNLLERENIFNKYYKVGNRFFWDSIATQNRGTKISATKVSIESISDVISYLHILYMIKDFNVEIDKIINGEINEFGEKDSGENTFVKNLCNRIIQRLSIEQRKLESEDKTHDQIKALSKLTLKNFSEQILSIIKNPDS